MEGAVVTLPGLDLASMADLLAAQLFAMLRIGAFLIASPAFGGRFVPLPVRIVAAVCLSLVVPQLYDMPDADSLAALSAIPLVLAEIAVGVVAGLVLTILFAAASIAGDQIANAAGLGFAVQLDPTAAGQSPVLAQFFSLALLLVFLGMNGHLMALRIMLDSYASFPPGAETGHCRAKPRGHHGGRVNVRAGRVVDVAGCGRVGGAEPVGRGADPVRPADEPVLGGLSADHPHHVLLAVAGRTRNVLGLCKPCQ